MYTDHGGVNPSSKSSSQDSQGGSSTGGAPSINTASQLCLLCSSGGTGAGPSVSIGPGLAVSTVQRLSMSGG